MKNILKIIGRLPVGITYILAIAFIGLIAYCFPRLFDVIGFIFTHGIEAFFLFVLIICIAPWFMKE